MSYYFVANIRIHNPKDYQKYIDGVDDVFMKYNGRYLAVDNHPELLEGDWHYSRFVIISFNSRKDFEAWYHSSEYQQILKYRLAAAACDTILVKGLDNQ